MLRLSAGGLPICSTAVGVRPGSSATTEHGLSTGPGPIRATLGGLGSCGDARSRRLAGADWLGLSWGTGRSFILGLVAALGGEENRCFRARSFACHSSCLVASSCGASGRLPGAGSSPSSEPDIAGTKPTAARRREIDGPLTRRALLIQLLRGSGLFEFSSTRGDRVANVKSFFSHKELSSQTTPGREPSFE